MADIEKFRALLKEERKRKLPLLAGLGLFSMAFGIYVFIGILFTGIDPAVAIGGAVLVIVGNIAVTLMTGRMRHLAKKVRELEREE